MVRSIGNVKQDAQVRAVASGALGNGDTVVVNSDGTVSVVSGEASAVSSPVVFESASSGSISSTFDSNSNKVVIAYQDAGNSYYGTAVVGTVSGGTITFGSSVVFESATTNRMAATFDSSSNKVVIAYCDNGNSRRGTSVVGTVSGTSISFGTAVVFDTSDTREISAAFDVSSSKVVIAYRDLGNSNYGTAIVGTVSGTSISFGSAVVFESSYTHRTSTIFDSNSNKIIIPYVLALASGHGKAIVGTVSGTSISFGSSSFFHTGGDTLYVRSEFDSSTNKIVIVYMDNANSNYGTAVVGTVSGTSISFGSEVVFNENRTEEISIAFDSSTNKMVVSYSDHGDSQKGTLITGTVSGTSISFDSPLVFEDGVTYYTSATFDPDQNKVVISYQDSGDSGSGKSVVFQNESINLTAENFIGFADGAYADTGSAVINTTCSVDRSQTGLTAGQKYYVQTDGSLGLTAADPSVEAGTAISATEILVKG